MTTEKQDIQRLRELKAAAEADKATWEDYATYSKALEDMADMLLAAYEEQDKLKVGQQILFKKLMNFKEQRDALTELCTEAISLLYDTDIRIPEARSLAARIQAVLTPAAEGE